MSIILDGTNGITSVTGAASLCTAGPAFSAYNTSNQTISSGTWTKVQLPTKLFDTNSNFDNATNYRFTPTVGGYYQLNAVVSTNASTGTALASFYKNGSLYQYGGANYNGSAQNASLNNTIMYFNGSTDYVELYYYWSGSSTLQGAQTQVWFNGAMVRSA